MTRNSKRFLGWRVLPALTLLTLALAGPLSSTTRGDDWPQFRGPHSDNQVTGFMAPATWPKMLTQKWKVTVGEGLASPALVGDKILSSPGKAATRSSPA